MGLEIDGSREYETEKGYNRTHFDHEYQFPFHKMIFSEENNQWKISSKITILDPKIERMIIVKKAEGSVKGGVVIEWGGKDEPTIEISGSAEIHDDKGNSVEVVVAENSDGMGSASINIEHDTDNSSQQ